MGQVDGTGRAPWANQSDRCANSLPVPTGPAREPQVYVLDPPKEELSKSTVSVTCMVIGLLFFGTLHSMGTSFLFFFAFCFSSFHSYL